MLIQLVLWITTLILVHQKGYCVWRWSLNAGLGILIIFCKPVSDYHGPDLAKRTKNMNRIGLILSGIVGFSWIFIILENMYLK